MPHAARSRSRSPGGALGDRGAEDGAQAILRERQGPVLVAGVVGAADDHVVGVSQKPLGAPDHRVLQIQRTWHLMHLDHIRARQGESDDQGGLDQLEEDHVGLQVEDLPSNPPHPKWVHDVASRTHRRSAGDGRDPDVCQRHAQPFPRIWQDHGDVVAARGQLLHERNDEQATFGGADHVHDPHRVVPSRSPTRQASTAWMNSCRTFSTLSRENLRATVTLCAQASS